MALAERAIGARTAEIRKHQGMTQAELAARLGMGQSVRRLQIIEGLSKRKKKALLTTIDAFLRGERAP